jgi:hypothetical protein
MTSSRTRGMTLRWGGTVVSVASLIGLGFTAPSSPASAASSTGFDQLTGVGKTASSVTIPWTAGLLDSSNQPISASNGELAPNSDRAKCVGAKPGADCGNGIVSFMYKDFKDLNVTVSQTQNIGHGGITVSWTGGLPTARGSVIQGNFLQMMECYGDSPAGPSPEGCEFGAPGLAGSTVQAPIGSRSGPLCAARVVQPPTGVPGADGSGPAAGCDPIEPTIPSHIDPCPRGECSPGQFSIPFVPADKDSGGPAYGLDVNQFYNAFNTNELQVATTGADHAGQQQFETDTFVQAPGLGCGEPEADGTPRGCWLVIVPRGDFEPNGFKPHLDSGSNAATAAIASSPLSAANWAQRIQVHLSYATLPTFCPPNGRTDDVSMEGTQLVGRAVSSWEVKLNQDANCARIYHLAPVSEQQVTNDFVFPAGANGLGFTTNPIGSDRVRAGEPAPPLPNIVYAPVAVAGLDFGFHIDEFSPILADPRQRVGIITTPVKLTPQLVARALTQSYSTDLPDFVPHLGKPGPAFAKKNPLNISDDTIFQKLNPEIIPFTSSSSPVAPFDTVDHTGLYRQIWNWLQSDSATKGWLAGTVSDPQIKVDPDYTKLNVATDKQFDQLPRAYSGCLDLGPAVGTNPPKEEKRCSIDLIPYVADFDAASQAVLTGNPLTFSSTWDVSATGPDGTPEYWDKDGIEPPGQIFISAVDSTPSLAGFGIVPAQLCNDSGGACVGPTTASVGAAVAHAKPDSQGLLEVNPADPGPGAFPLTQVIYAAVRTDEQPGVLKDYADLISFAANQGQATGQAAGDLPAGYLPLPASLVRQANAAVAKLRSIAGGGNPTSAPPTTHAPSQPTRTPGGPATATATVANPGTTPPAQPAPTTAPAPAAGPTPTPGSTTPAPSPTGPVIIPPTAQLAAGATPSQPVGPIRQVLTVVLIVGIAGAGLGIALRSGRLPWRRRRPRT